MNDQIREADAADREADEIFAMIDRAREEEGSSALIPTGQRANATRASELRFRARILRANAETDSQSAPMSAGAPAPPPVVPTACKPSAAGAGPLTLEMAEITVAATRGETARCLAIMAEAKALSIANEDVDAALAARLTAEEFVERYAPLEALARQIVAAAPQ